MVTSVGTAMVYVDVVGFVGKVIFSFSCAIVTVVVVVFVADLTRDFFYFPPFTSYQGLSLFFVGWSPVVGLVFLVGFLDFSLFYCGFYCCYCCLGCCRGGHFLRAGSGKMAQLFVRPV